MTYQIGGKTYPVEIQRKNNKNSYLRVREDQTILVTTHFFVTDRQVEKFLNTNQEAILKMLEKKCKQLEKEGKFYYLGQEYDIILSSEKKQIEIEGKTIIAPDEKKLRLWKRTEMVRIFKERLDAYYRRFEESIPYPKLKIRTMKTRWGVCNRRDNSVTINTKLLDYEIAIIDYVIVHELSHFVCFDHSRAFWEVVAKYYPFYKKARKILKE